ncbi:MAG: RNA polymerase factor sigma-32 [Deltaproteobacteria bacterium]|nr:MAG: RNA polymerase factor sigma-32 [Deltaproteobacteria bacterium]
MSGKKKDSLVVTDPLQRYLQEVSRFPLLSREEENELVKRLREQEDIEAAKKLVTSNLRLVVKIAMEYRTTYHNILDLIQEGNIGLMKAVSKYDPDKGTRLSYYASWWIRAYILKYILDNFRLIKIGTTQVQRKLFYNLMKEKKKIEAMGCYPDRKLLAESLGVKEEEVDEMSLRLGSSEFSLDQPDDRYSGGIQLEFLQNHEAPPDEKLSDAEFKDILFERFDEFSKTLDERELSIFKERLLAEVPVTLQEIADRYGISKEWARQLEDRIIKKLRTFLQGELE